VGYSTEGEDAHPAALSTIRPWDTAPANRADRAFGDGWASSTGGVGYSTEGEDAHPAALSTIRLEERVKRYRGDHRAKMSPPMAAHAAANVNVHAAPALSHSAPLAKPPNAPPTPKATLP
jgi:hypothetical protein